MRTKASTRVQEARRGVALALVTQAKASLQAARVRLVGGANMMPTLPESRAVERIAEDVARAQRAVDLILKEAK